ncbi:hypothetical protein [Kitasatospora kifunensis]|uniref:Streptomyces killer toxin-like beta/gamma crystallin domain-containing protein n=1 Tax=Kitasatospora kifunensis TaxID=58351 RepID=A0A7W7VZZ4_KITKI|nr:hypothetical protein [Kitasatospora kifunensis]MBB4928125.1 hypothetical protein [Kitasatospora kifunensis]
MNIRRRLALPLAAAGILVGGVAAAAPANAAPQPVGCPTNGVNVYQNIWSTQDNCFAGTRGPIHVWITDAYMAYSAWNNYEIDYYDSQGNYRTDQRNAGQVDMLSGFDTVTAVWIK